MANRRVYVFQVLIRIKLFRFLLFLQAYRDENQSVDFGKAQADAKVRCRIFLY